MSAEERDARKTPPGRPRDPAKGDSILRAAAELLREGGYAGLSIEAVAQRAGVSRPTVYRRYQNKADLVIDVVTSMGPTDAARLDGASPAGNGGASLVEDLDALLKRLSAAFDAFVEQGVMPSFLADLVLYPELAKRFFNVYLAAVQQSMQDIVAAAVQRGEIAEGPLPDVVLSSLVGTYVYHRFVIVQEFGEEERRRLARLIANGLSNP